VLATAGAYYAAQRQEKRYSATASLLFQTSQFSQELFGYAAVPANEDPTTEQATNVALVSEPIIAVDVAKTLHGLAPSTRVAHEVSVAAAGASDLVNVTATDPSPVFAARLADAYAAEVVNYAEATQRAQVDQAAGQLRSQISQLPARSPQYSVLETRLSELEALASLQTGNVQLAGQALTPGTPSSPHVLKDTALGLIGGLLIGLFAVLLAERVDARLRDIDETEQLLGLPILGVIPATRVLNRSRASHALAAGDAAEAFRQLRVQLHYFNVDREIRSLLVTSAGPGDGKSTVAWNLACAVAVLSPESSILLVDCDLRRPTIAEMAGEQAIPGLAEVLTRDDVTVSSALRTFELGAEDGRPPVDVRVLTAGATPPNPTELLESQKFRSLVENLQARFDLVILDAPPPLVVPDAIPLTRQVSGVLVVARVRHTKRAAAVALRDQLLRLGTPCLGLVVNGVASRQSPYSGYSAYSNGRAREQTLGPSAALASERDLGLRRSR
jgi:capsular exopolysaccharide synthesis family protein